MLVYSLPLFWGKIHTHTVTHDINLGPVEERLCQKLGVFTDQPTYKG